MERKNHGQGRSPADGERNEEGPQGTQSRLADGTTPMQTPVLSQRAAAAVGWIVSATLVLAPSAVGTNKVKLHGYLTGRADSTTVVILDDRIETSSATRVLAKDEAGEHSFREEDLAPGMLVEAEGQWLDKHKFFAERMTVD